MTIHHVLIGGRWRPAPSRSAFSAHDAATGAAARRRATSTETIAHRPATPSSVEGVLKAFVGLNSLKP